MNLNIKADLKPLLKDLSEDSFTAFNERANAFGPLSRINFVNLVRKL